MHDVILATGEDPDPNIATRRASFLALDALEGDFGFFARTCDCRSLSTSSPKQDMENRKMQLALEEDGGEEQVEKVKRTQLALEEDGEIEHEESDIEDGMIVE